MIQLVILSNKNLFLAKILPQLDKSENFINIFDWVTWSLKIKHGKATDRLNDWVGNLRYRVWLYLDNCVFNSIFIAKFIFYLTILFVDFVLGTAKISGAFRNHHYHFTLQYLIDHWMTNSSSTPVKADQISKWNDLGPGIKPINIQMQTPFATFASDFERSQIFIRSYFPNIE